MDCYVRDGPSGTQNVGREEAPAVIQEKSAGLAQSVCVREMFGRWREEGSGVKQFRSWREQLGDWGCSNEVLTRRTSGGWGRAGARLGGKSQECMFGHADSKMICGNVRQTETI